MIAREVTGHGPPLVMVHGASNDRTSFRLVAPILAEQMTVMAVDRRGRGESPDDGMYSIAAEADDVAEVVRDGGDATVLMGHSYGALVALEAGLLLGDVLPRLVLYEPPMGGQLASPELIAELDALFEAGEPEQMLETFLLAVSGSTPEEIDAMRELPSWRGRLDAAHTVPRELRAEAAWEFEPARYAELRVPTLMLVGEHSPDWAKRSTKAIAGALPEVAVVELEGQGHSATVEAPGQLARALTAFLSI